jgi:hypothetical protein
VKFLITVGVALLLLTIESVLVKYLGFAVVRIDVTVALVVFLALRASTIEGAISSFTIGYLLDVMGGNPTWLYCFLAVLVFLLVRLGSSLVDVRSAFMFVVFVGAADLGHGLLAAFFSWMTSKEGIVPTVPLSGLVWQVPLTAAAALAMWPVLRKFDPGNERPEVGALR